MLFIVRITLVYGVYCLIVFPLKIYRLLDKLLEFFSWDVRTLSPTVQGVLTYDVKIIKKVVFLVLCYRKTRLKISFF